MSQSKKAGDPGAPWADVPPDDKQLEQASRGFLDALCSSEDREMLEASARRMAEAWSEDLLAGYRTDPATVVTAFPAGDDQALVLVAHARVGPQRQDEIGGAQQGALV